MTEKVRLESKVEYSLIIPCYNEIENLERLWKSCMSLLEKRDDIEVILVNNGSTDGSDSALDKILITSNTDRLKCVTLTKNQGYGHGILSGLNAARGCFVGWCHADLQTDPIVFLECINLLREQKSPCRSYVKAKRIGRKFKDVIFSYAMTVIEVGLLGVWMSDINSQPNIFHRDILTKWGNPPKDFSLDLYAFYMAKKLKLSVVRFPVYFGIRNYGIGHNDHFLSKLKLSYRTILFSLELRKIRKTLI